MASVALVALGLTGATHGSGCRDASAGRVMLTYRIDALGALEPTAPLSVTIRLLGLRGDSLALQLRSPADLAGLGHIVAAADDGALLQVDSSSVRLDLGERELRIPRFVIRGPLPEQMLVHYTILPGRREGSAHTGWTGRQYGASEASYRFASGRMLFLVPEHADVVSEIRVRCDVPDSWRALVPWPMERQWFRVPGQGTAAAEALIAGVVGLGQFDERTVELHGRPMRLACPHGVTTGAFEQAARRFTEMARAVEGLTSRPAPAGYLALLLPRSSAGLEIIGEASGLGQGQTLIPLTPGRLREATRDFLGVFLRYPEERTNVTREDEYWLVDGLQGWLGARLATAAFGYSREDVLRLLAGRFLEASVNPNFHGRLDDLYQAGSGHKSGRDLTAPLVVGLLDAELRQAKPAPDSIEHLLPRFLAGRRAPSFWSLLPGGFTRARYFRDSVASGRVPPPVGAVWNLEPLEPNPDSLPGRAQHWLDLAYTGRMEGFLENCGCKVNQAGGAARRASVLGRFRREHPGGLVLDAGEAFLHLVRQQGLDVQTEAESRLAAELLAQERYDVLAIGTSELTFGPSRFTALTTGRGMPYVAANLSLPTGPPLPPLRLFRRDDLEVAVIGAFEQPAPAGALSHFFEESAESLRVAEPVAAVRRTIESLHPRPDVLCVIGNLSPRTIRRLVRACPELALVISTEFTALLGPPDREEAAANRQEHPGFSGRTLVLYARSTRYGVSTARLGIDSLGHVARADLGDVLLGDSIPDDRATRARLDRFYTEMGATFARAEARWVPFASDAERMQGGYVGAEACRKCHAEAYAQWKATPHADAYRTLLENRRHSNPDCVACHVVGLGTTGGFRFGSPDESRANVQCESCHGPGARHLAHPVAGNIARQVPERVCLECHTPEHTDQFDYSTRLPLVEHRALTPAAPVAAARQGDRR